MFFLIRLGLLILSIVIIGGYIIQHVPSIKAEAINLFNPVAYQNSLIAQLDTALQDLNSSSIEIKNSHNQTEIATQLQKQQALIQKSEQLLGNLQKQKNSISVIDRSIGKIVDLALGSPLPMPSPTSSNPAEATKPETPSLLDTFKELVTGTTEPSPSPVVTSPMPSLVCPPNR